MSQEPKTVFTGSLHRFALLRRTWEVNRRAFKDPNSPFLKLKRKRKQDDVNKETTEETEEDTSKKADECDDPDIDQFFESIETEPDPSASAANSSETSHSPDSGNPGYTRATTPEKDLNTDDAVHDLQIHGVVEAKPFRTQPSPSPTSFDVDPKIFIDPDITMSDTTQPTPDHATHLAIPAYISTANIATLELYHSALNKYVQSRSQVQSFLPLLNKLATFIVHPQQILTAPTGKALRPILALVHEIQDDLTAMPTHSDLEGLRDVMAAALDGKDTISLPSTSPHKDTENEPGIDSPMSGMSPPSPTSHPDPLFSTDEEEKGKWEFTFSHDATANVPLESLMPLFGIINHEYGALIEGPIKKVAKLRDLLGRVQDGANLKVRAELMQVRFGEMVEEWQGEVRGVWWGLGGLGW
ncbi:Hypothetical protein D9617_13g098970 [Elsinoe fawcettii]|nr:Hypothetical protein D9617_13g098970 [Elsinoe fawcettii]